jgi:hypothetical protein
VVGPRCLGCSIGCPPDPLARRRAGLPGSWGTPVCACPALRPRQARHARPSCGVSTRPSVYLTTSALTVGYLSRLHHAACTLPVYASQGGSLRHHATLGSGWWPSSTGRAWVPAGFRKRFPRRPHRSTSLSPSPGFAWRTSGGPGSSPARGSHRSGRARLAHPAPRIMASLPGRSSTPRPAPVASLSDGVAWRWPRRSVPPSSVPPPGPCSGIPFPPRGPLGRVPPLPRYSGMLRLLLVRPAALRSLHATVPRLHSIFVPEDRECTIPGPGLFHRVSLPIRRRGDEQVSQVPGEPPGVHAPLFDPGELFTPGRLSACRHGLPFS